MERAFANKDVNETVKVFNETISNVLSDYIPHEVVIFDEQDHPWINNKIKKLIHQKNEFYNEIKPNIQKEIILKKLQYLQNQLNNAMDFAKEQYYK